MNNPLDHRPQDPQFDSAGLPHAPGPGTAASGPVPRDAHRSFPDELDPRPMPPSSSLPPPSLPPPSLPPPPYPGGAVRVDRRRRRRLGLLTVAVVAAGAVGIGPLTFLSSTTTSVEGSYSGVTKLLMDGIGDADVHVMARQDASEVHVLAEVKVGRMSGNDPVVGGEVKGGVLALPSACDAVGGCTASYTITVPVDMEVELDATSGDIEVSGVSGPVTANSSSGDITVTEASGSVTARASSGDVDVRRFQGDRLSLRADSGDVTVDAVSTPASVDAQAASGDVTVAVPAGPYKVDASTVSGHKQVDVEDDASSPRTITVRATSGDVTVGAG